MPHILNFYDFVFNTPHEIPIVRSMKYSLPFCGLTFCVTSSLIRVECKHRGFWLLLRAASTDSTPGNTPALDPPPREEPKVRFPGVGTALPPRKSLYLPGYRRGRAWRPSGLSPAFNLPQGSSGLASNTAPNKTHTKKHTHKTHTPRGRPATGMKPWVA